LAKEGDFEQAQKELGVWLKTDKGKGDEEAKELVGWHMFCLGLSCSL
jgi:hypothetical protein